MTDNTKNGRKVYKVRTPKTATAPSPQISISANSIETMVVAAKARIEADKLMGIETPESIINLANINPTPVASPEIAIEDETLPEEPQETLTPNLEFEPEAELVIPDQWIVKAPEDPELPFLLNFYKKGKIVTTFPLTEDNVSTLMPVLETFYPRDEEIDKGPLFDRMLALAKKYKFRTAALIIIGILVIVGLIMTATTGLGHTG